MLGFFLFPTALGRCAVAYGDHGIVATALPSQTEAATVRSLLRLVRERHLEDREPERTSSPPPFVLDAAAKLSRRCFAMEQEPRYVDVAVMRWEASTGEKAERLS